MPKREQTWYCDFCGKSQQEALKMLTQDNDAEGIAICDDCVDLFAEILIEEGVRESRPARIDRSIELPYEYRQAGVTILSYFSAVLTQKLPDLDVKIRIEQDGNTVRLVVISSDGDSAIIKEVLESYSLVVKGRMEPEQLLSDPLDVLALKNKLEMVHIDLKRALDLSGAKAGVEVDRFSIDKRLQEFPILIGSGLQSLPNAQQ